MNPQSGPAVHICRVAMQPATRMVDDSFDPPLVFECKPGALVWCRCCNQQRRAGNCVGRVYYDALEYRCADGSGCQSAHVIEAQRRRAFRNRSQAQKRRYATAPQ